MNLPPSWTIAKLGDVCFDPQYGYTTKASDNGDIKLLRTTDITSGVINWLTVPYCTENPKEVEKLLLKDGDIVISRAGSIGFSMLVDKPQKAVFASYLIRFSPLIYRKYLYNYLKSESYWNQISEKSLGIAIPNVNATKLKEVELPISPLPEQHRIVAKLEELFSQLDSSVSELRKAKEQVKVYKQSVLKYAFEGKLNVENQQVKINEKTGLPEGWKLSRIEEVSSDIVDCLHSTPKFKEFGKFCVDTTCIEPTKIIWGKIRFVSEATFNERIRRLKPIYGDIFFAREGTIGTALVVPQDTDVCLGQRMMMFRPNNSIISKYFMYGLLSNHFIKEYKPKIGGSTSPHVNIRDLKLMTLPIAPLNEQEQIVLEIETRFSEAENLEKTIDLSLNQAESLRQSILKKAFEGRLVPQDPNDEPAVKLLVRIKDEKENNNKKGKK